MRQVVWLLMMFAIAVLAASTLGANDGLVSIYWAPWRVDLSINVFVLLLLAAGFVGHVLTGAVSGLIDLPQRARQWRCSARCARRWRSSSPAATAVRTRRRSRRWTSASRRPT
jgi:HemY protein